MEESKELTTEEKRAARKAELAKAEEEQRQKDLEVIDELEIQHGDSNIAILRVPFTPGFPVLLAVRTPKEPEVKRYRSRLKSEDKDQAVAAAGEIAETCVVYPSREVFAQLAKLRPNLHVDCGARALKLAVASNESEGKG